MLCACSTRNTFLPSLSLNDHSLQTRAAASQQCSPCIGTGKRIRYVISEYLSRDLVLPLIGDVGVDTTLICCYSCCSFNFFCPPTPASCCWILLNCCCGHACFVTIKPRKTPISVFSWFIWFFACVEFFVSLALSLLFNTEHNELHL